MTEEQRLENRRLALDHIYRGVNSFDIGAADAVKEAAVLAAFLDGKAE